LLGLARAADSLGYHGVTIGEHLLYPREMSQEYPYVEPFNDQVPWPDQWAAISAMAAATRRLRFSTAITLVALRPPAWLAKQVATAAILSDYRVAVGVGTGWMREEFAGAEQPFAHRGARTDEALELIRRLWEGGVVEHNGRFFNYEPFGITPVPHERIPIYIGGDTDAALRRAARHDGWLGMLYDHDEAAAQIERFQQARHEAGTDDRDDVEVALLFKTVPTVEDVVRLAELGYNSVHVVPWWKPGVSRMADPGDQAIRASLERFAEGVLGRLPALA
jgi:probable F420-dependent oxidoreductase